MESYEWPGNGREIKNIIHRAAVMCAEKVLLPKHLPKRLLEGSGNSHPVDIRVITPRRVFWEQWRKSLCL
ncbi:MAG: hypothetical protein J7K96_04515 [Desulfobacteraceae bacterium]|nr:hypothetical protein [Desulfobacteraceae bacterium]